MKLKIVNVLGEEVQGMNSIIKIQIKECLINSSQLKNGMYFIEINEGGFIFREGIIVSH